MLIAQSDILTFFVGNQKVRILHISKVDENLQLVIEICIHEERILKDSPPYAQNREKTIRNI